jgi:hypothetical protein
MLYYRKLVTCLITVKRNVIKVGAESIVLPVNRDFVQLSQRAIDNSKLKDAAFDNEIVSLLRHATHALVDPSCSVREFFFLCFCS